MPAADQQTQQQITSDVPQGMPEELTPEGKKWRENLKKIAAQPHISYPCFAQFCDDPEHKVGFKPARVAKWLAENEHFKTDRESDTLYYGDEVKGVWSRNGETKLKEIVTRILGDEDKAHHYANILHTLKSLTYTDVVFSKKIAVENGLLDVETGKLSPFTLEEMAFHSIPVAFNKDADCPNFKEWLKQVLKPEDILTLQEWSGFLLLPDYREHKIMWLHGSGRNGKGTWTRTMESILGADNCASVPLEQFDGYHRFAMERLIGKLFNTCNEPTVNNKKVLRTELLKAATGQDTIEAEIKCKQKTIKFRNTAKITVIANRFPKVEDNTTAFKNRRLFVTFPYEFIGKNKISNIEQVWLNDATERSGILNWMLEGLHRLLSQGYFTEGKTQQETEILFQRASDTIGAFISEMVIFNKNSYKGRAEVHAAYKEYCDFYGLENENEKALVSRLKNTPKISEGKRLVNGKRERCWIGIDLRKLPEEEEKPVDTSEEQQQTTLEQKFDVSEAESGTGGTDGTGQIPQRKIGESLILDGYSTRVPSVPCVPDNQPLVLAKDCV
ncbi:MAG: phage/plasmid primase, P4 family, partial [Candidatus Bathyarchaeota archaeon]|nr:phage/plasmid primase, P4 family [Candidatus Bathyarchaeota archaeon]